MHVIENKKGLTQTQLANLLDVSKRGKYDGGTFAHPDIVLNNG